MRLCDYRREDDPKNQADALVAAVKAAIDSGTTSTLIGIGERWRHAKPR